MRLGIALGVLLTLASGAEAASFDCAKASHPVEKAVCGNPDLSRLDEEVGRLYRDRLSLLSSQGQELLRRSQREWVAFVRKLCADGDVECVDRHTKLRHDSLEQEFRRVGPYTFMAVQRYALRPVSRHNPFRNTMKYSQLVQSYPRIDAPPPEAVFWNEIAKGNGLPDEAKEDEDYYSGFEVESATGELISLRRHIYLYGHGAAHGMSGSDGMNTVMKQARPLKAEDLFRQDTDWPRLGDTAIRELRRQADTEDVELFKLKPAEITAAVAEPARWLIRPEGLVVLFHRYEVGPGSFGEREVLFPWAELRPYLQPHAPVAAFLPK
jgi:uncharacterized protein